jgi:hypothetical protein
MQHIPAPQPIPIEQAVREFLQRNAVGQGFFHCAAGLDMVY